MEEKEGGNKRKLQSVVWGGHCLGAGVGVWFLARVEMGRGGVCWARAGSVVCSLTWEGRIGHVGQRSGVVFIEGYVGFACRVEGGVMCADSCGICGVHSSPRVRSFQPSFTSLAEARGGESVKGFLRSVW